jgi:sortase A
MIPRLRHASTPPGKGGLILRVASYLFLAIGTLALGYSASVVGGAHAYQAAEISRFEHPGRSAEPLPLSEGGLIGEILVPRLKLKVIVAEGVSPGVLKRAVGHIPETALPGELGNVALAGHRDTFFRPLRDIHLGDVIILKTSDTAFQYRVESTAIVPPSDVQVLQTSSGRTLTLITCFPFYYVGSAPDRFIVRAREVEPSAQHPPERQNPPGP